ncbi:hypothetical protein BDV30DRAFT_206378 [Aspergillus minisclerotigenes]|uniref:Uncharacterized protein n=1 Tax=Aspergillus minisclerotigenes TaxID=656917 RepID=A0A5N6JDC6_9EURO|nr:hypothetical protein BDV30DRAFT_206378 [Aspergillus minisclerotigenes]
MYHFLDRFPGTTISGSTHLCLTWDFGFSFLFNFFAGFLYLARSLWSVLMIEFV